MSNAHDNEALEEFIEISPEEEGWVTVFVGSLDNCRERLKELEYAGVPSIILKYEEIANAMGPPALQLKVREEDIEDVSDIFREIWEEVLVLEGVGDHVNDVIDLSADTIICPGCQTETDTVTEEGECPECGLFLGLPEEFEEAERP